jgi:DNA polymerase epsilon subunit 1
LDEYNYGGIQLERRNDATQEDEIAHDLLIQEEDGDKTVTIIPFVVSGWNMKNYLDSEIAQEYFRAIVGRFSKDVLSKELKLRMQGASVFYDSCQDQLLVYKRKLISKHFSSYLTRAVGEISKDAEGTHHSVHSPLEFIKSVMAVLELDADVQEEVHVLKRSLLAQIGVPEYASVVKWENPCVKFILPDVFCVECHESRDVNLCDQDDEEGANLKQWACQDCGTLYPSDDIERRLIDICNRKMIRYQLQDLRCVKTNRVATRALSKQSDCSANLKLDISRDQALSQMRILYDIAIGHDLEFLQETVGSFLDSTK